MVGAALGQQYRLEGELRSLMERHNRESARPAETARKGQIAACSCFLLLLEHMPANSVLKTTQSHNLMVLEVRSLKWVSLEQN